jgi:hypothetical protein
MRPLRFEQRLEILEAHHRGALQRPSRVFQCIVRKGQEEADKRAAFTALGIFPTDDDLTICFVAVSPNPANRMEDLKPSALLVAD